MSAIVHPTAIN